MPVETIRFGIFQISCHPAVVLAGRDCLQDPISYHPGTTSLTDFGHQSLELRQSLIAIGQRYLQWQQERLDRLLAWLSSQPELPQFIAFPECSIPFDSLATLREFAKRTGIVCFAGTHTPRLAAQAKTFYKKTLGVLGPNVKSVLDDANPAPAVLPVLTGDASFLQGKAVASIFERTEIDPPEAGPLMPTILSLNTPQINVASLVCAEARRMISWPSSLPQFALILARETHPEGFNARIQEFIDNQIPVVLVNDGTFGGSGIFTVIDNRSAGWWYKAPCNGRLPPGDAYLEVEVDLNATAVEVGVAVPGCSARFLKVTPIVYADDPLRDFELQAAEAANTRNAGRLTAIRMEIEKTANHAPLISRRWGFVETLLATDSLSDQWLLSVGQHISTDSLVSLPALERELASIAVESISHFDNTHSPEALSDEGYGQLMRLQRHLKQVAGTQSKPSAHIPCPTNLPIGRDSMIAEVRSFATRTDIPVLILTGLEAVGKTAVLQAALRQAAARVLAIQCLPGHSADFVFEHLLKATGRGSVGTAPREDFSVDDIADALTTVDVVWFQNCESLTQYGNWHTNALAKLFSRLVLASQRTRTRLVFETRRAVSLDEPLGLQVVRRRLQGLKHPDNVALFEQQLRRAGVPLEIVSDENRTTIATRATGHPGMLILCADACANQGVDSVISDLQDHKGSFWSAVSRLVKGIDLSPVQKKCFDALAQCRLPVPPVLLTAFVNRTEYVEALAQLIGACLVDRGANGHVAVAPLLRAHRIDFGAASEDELRAFHKAAADHFAEIVDSTAATSTLPAAIEANYHAALGNIAPPCPLAGILDGVAAAARREYDLENYLGVVTLLGPLVNERVSEDLVAMLAESYAWTNNYGESFTLSDQAVKRNRNYAWLYISICKAAIRSHEWDVARKAVRKAEAVEPGSYEVDLYKGRIAERDRAPDTAIAHFQDACSKTEKDPWPHFYLARALLRYGKPEEALDAIASGQRLVSDRPFRRSDRHFENALMSQQVLALLLVGQDEPARKLLEILETREDVRPEIIVCAAFVRARDDALSAGQSSLECFEAALKRLNAGDSQKRFTRQQILYFRARILEEIGDLREAEREFDQASSLDPHNVHIKTCLLNVLVKIAKRAKTKSDRNAANSAAERAAEVATAILLHDPNHQRALYVQEDLYHEFGVE